MKIAIGADHAGFDLKEQVKKDIEAQGYEVVDLGAHTYDSLDDYPDFARLVAENVADGNAARGIVVCGSGVGANIAANKVPGVRASMITDSYSAHQGVEHDDMNVLVLGGRVSGTAIVAEIVNAFLHAEFSGEERHVRRLNKVLQIEKDYNRE